MKYIRKTSIRVYSSIMYDNNKYLEYFILSLTEMDTHDIIIENRRFWSHKRHCRNMTSILVSFRERK